MAKRPLAELSGRPNFDMHLTAGGALALAWCPGSPAAGDARR